METQIEFFKNICCSNSFKNGVNFHFYQKMNYLCGRKMKTRNFKYFFEQSNSHTISCIEICPLEIQKPI